MLTQLGFHIFNCARRIPSVFKFEYGTFLAFSLEPSTSSLIFARFFVVITFAYTQLRAISSRATQFISPNRQLRLSFYIFSYFFPLSLPLPSVSNSIAMSIIDMNCNVPIFFAVLLEACGFESKFNFRKLSVKSLLQQVATETVPAAKENLESMEFKALRKNSAPKIAQHLTSMNLAFHEFRTEQTCRVLGAFLAVYTYALNDGSV